MGPGDGAPEQQVLRRGSQGDHGRRGPMAGSSTIDAGPDQAHREGDQDRRPPRHGRRHRGGTDRPRRRLRQLGPQASQRWPVPWQRPGGKEQDLDGGKKTEHGGYGGWWSQKGDGKHQQQWWSYGGGGRGGAAEEKRPWKNSTAGRGGGRYEQHGAPSSAPGDDGVPDHPTKKVRLCGRRPKGNEVIVLSAFDGIGAGPWLTWDLVGQRHHQLGGRQGGDTDRQLPHPRRETQGRHHAVTGTRVGKTPWPRPRTDKGARVAGRPGGGDPGSARHGHCRGAAAR